MNSTVREHINRLESRIQRLNQEIMENRSSQEERNRLEAEIRAAKSTLTHYRAALEIENQSLWKSD
jgi:predicted aspartyl protease